jgi:hypothetical protein
VRIVLSATRIVRLGTLVPLVDRQRDVFGVAIVAALIALALSFGAQRGRRAAVASARAGEITELVGPIARFSFFPTSGRIDVASADGRSRIELEMSLVVDGAERPLVMRRSEVQLRDKNTLAAAFPIEHGDEHVADAVGTLELRMDPASDLLSANLVVMPEPGSVSHTYALRVGMSPEGREIFVPGAGGIADLGTVDAKAVVIDDDAHPFALSSTQGSLALNEIPPDTDAPNAQPRISVSARTESAAERPIGSAGKPARLDLAVLVGTSSRELWGRLYRMLRVPVARVSGVVTGAHERAHVIALDEEGHAQLRAVADSQGRFVVESPTSAVQWYAVLEAAHQSAPVHFVPGTPWDLRLDVSPGGELHVRVVDADTDQPIVARLLVHGIDGTLDPSFGPDYRASGAGPLMDMLEGEVTTPLPSGKYRVAATRGIEWSIDSDVVEIGSARTKNVELALRHVVPTSGQVGCDLHVHARPSFDSPVTPEDRVLSLVAAGIDFAVPTEHNIVGDYAPAIDVLHVNKMFASVTGVEVTTYNPRFGHFGVFPYPQGPVPPFKGTTAGAMFAAAHRGDPKRVVQVNHPRLQMGIGYFNNVGFDPHAGRLPGNLRLDFDTLEVYNGFELGRRALTERVMDDWYALLNFGRHIAATGSSDSHRIQYMWAGYPRTFVLLDPRQAGDTGGAIDTAAVVAAIKSGHSYVSSGPVLEIELTSEGKTAHPGDELPVPRGGTIAGHLRVRAAPWIDVTDLQVIAGSPPPPAPPWKPPPRPRDPDSATPAPPRPPPPPAQPGTITTVYSAKMQTRPLGLGKEDGSLEEAATRSLRYDTSVTFQVPDNAKWIVVIVRGDRAMDDILPFMPVQPMAFTNPIWLAR